MGHDYFRESVNSPALRLGEGVMAEERPFALSHVAEGRDDQLSIYKLCKQGSSNSP